MAAGWALHQVIRPYAALRAGTQKFRLRDNSLNIVIETVSMAIGTGIGLSDHDGFAPLTHFVLCGICDDLGSLLLAFSEVGHARKMPGWMGSCNDFQR